MPISPEAWRGRTVLVTGGTGFIGSFVVQMLTGVGARVRVPTRRLANATRFLEPYLRKIEVVEADLTEPSDAKRVITGQEVVLHLAAVVGGIQYNIDHPASIFRDNLRGFITTLEAARAARVERVLVTSSACVYPRHCSIPTPEEEGFNDTPEPTNEGYGWAKRMEEFLAQSYAKEYGMRIAIARPYNGYGPRDNFAPESSHVIPALIRRIWKSRERPLTVWGSGKQSRSFLYVEDFARGLIEVAERYAVADPLNLGSSQETTIAELVGILQALYRETRGESLEVAFDASKPEGQPRRCCDTRKAEAKIGFHARWGLEEGLRETVKWYLQAGMPG